MKNSDTAESKRLLRERFLAARLALSADERAAHSTAICERIAALPEIQRAETVHVYWPILARGEVDTRPLIRSLRARGKTVVLPVVVGFEGGPRLRHVRFEGEGRMRRSRWGITEPVGTDDVPAETLDAIVVPAFGAGRNGHRIGHGAGFYDAFLAGLQAPTIGAVYAGCLAEHVPAEAHDVPLTLIVTEREVWRSADH